MIKNNSSRLMAQLFKISPIVISVKIVNNNKLKLNKIKHTIQ